MAWLRGYHMTRYNCLESIRRKPKVPGADPRWKPTDLGPLGRGRR